MSATLNLSQLSPDWHNTMDYFHSLVHKQESIYGVIAELRKRRSPKEVIDPFRAWRSQIDRVMQQMSIALKSTQISHEQYLQFQRDFNHLMNIMNYINYRAGAAGLRQNVQAQWVHNCQQTKYTDLATAMDKAVEVYTDMAKAWGGHWCVTACAAVSCVMPTGSVLSELPENYQIIEVVVTKDFKELLIVSQEDYTAALEIHTDWKSKFTTVR